MARYSEDHKVKTRERIIETAGARLKSDGIDGSGVATLMTDAGLTNGAFYSHFASKSDLVATVVAAQLDAQCAVIEALPVTRESFEAFVRDYLSPQHRDDSAAGCPSAALLDEIGRCEDDVRSAYTAGIRRMIDAIAVRINGDDPQTAHRLAIGVFTLLVSTMQLARAVDDPELSEQVLAAGRANALALAP